MNPDDLIFKKPYIIEISNNNHFSAYWGKFFKPETNDYGYMFLVSDYIYTLTEDQVKHKVQPVPFMYRAIFGGIGGFRQWLINLIKMGTGECFK